MCSPHCFTPQCIGIRVLSWESHDRCPKSRTNHEAFAARWYPGESRHRHETRRFTQVLAPLCLEVKTYSCFLLLSGTDSSNRRVGGTITVVARNFRLEEI